MDAIANPARQRLENGEVSLGFGIRVARSVEIAKAMRTAGFDWMFLDFEHGAMSIETAAALRSPGSMRASPRWCACRGAIMRSPRACSTTARLAW